MGIVELILIAVSLSMDAFAVSVCKGIKMPKMKYSHLFIIALFFGGFQMLMPLLGWLLGKQFEEYIVSFDHWIAFALLAFIGGKMLFEALRGGDSSGDKADNTEKCGCSDCSQGETALNIKELTVLAVATSIDALAVGITFAFMKVSILPSVSLIGITTFIFCSIGVFIGHRFGSVFGNKAEIFGGIILILIGLKILLEHLGILNF